MTGKELITKVVEDGFKYEEILAEGVTTESFVAEDCNEYVYCNGTAEFINGSGASVVISDDADYVCVEDGVYEQTKNGSTVRISIGQ